MNLYTCNHPLEMVAQCMSLSVNGSTALQVCANCGSHRWLPGEGWVRPLLVEAEVRKVLANLEAPPPA